MSTCYGSYGLCYVSRPVQSLKRSTNCSSPLPTAGHNKSQHNVYHSFFFTVVGGDDSLKNPVAWGWENKMGQITLTSSLHL